LQALFGERRSRWFVAMIIAQGIAVLMIHPCVAAELAFDSSGNLFFEGNNTGTIFKYAPDGSRKTFASSTKDTSLNGGLAVAPNGDVYACANFTTILKFAPDGTKSIFATDVGKSWPNALVVDAAGNLFVSASGDTIFKFTPDGINSMFATGVVAYGLAFDRNGNLFACDSHGENGRLVSALIKFAPDGSKTVVAPSESGYGLAFDRAGDLFVAGSEGILKFTSDGRKSSFVAGIDVSGGLAFDPTGNLVASNGNNKIARFAPDGTKKAFAKGPSIPGAPNEKAEDSSEGLPKEYAEGYLIASSTISPGRKIAIIYPKFSDDADDSKIKNDVVALKPFAILGTLDTKRPYFERQSHGGLSAEWSKDGAAGLVTLESKWGPGDIILLELCSGKISRQTNLTAKMHDLLVSDYRKAKAAPYNDEYDFIFESRDAPTCKLDGLQRVRIDAFATTDPKGGGDGRIWEGRLKATWDIAQGRFTSKKVDRVFTGVRNHEN
jgi:sugar lactone lactonase YvrE